jgi:hypothetical protein
MPRIRATWLVRKTEGRFRRMARFLDDYNRDLDLRNKSGHRIQKIASLDRQGLLDRCKTAGDVLTGDELVGVISTGDVICCGLTKATDLWETNR